MIIQIIELIKDEGMQFKYDAFGAYVMFPYSDEEKFKDHDFYKSIEKVNIGTFPPFFQFKRLPLR